MSFYSGPSSVGTCNACGSPVHDGGQSGVYCSNNACRYGWGGGGGPSAKREPRHELTEAEREALLRRTRE